MLSANEIQIDDRIYSIDEFSKTHPGGDAIRAFAGTNATTYYRMIHSRHGSGNARLRRCMPSRPVPESSATLLLEFEYNFDSEFARDLRQAVHATIGHVENEAATPDLLFRMAMYVILWVWTLSQWIAHPSLWYGLLLGMAMAMIGLNVQHDANHGALWTYPFLQSMLGFALDTIGGSKYLWIQQHWSHHAHTNSAQDCDAFSTLPFLMLQPPHGDKGTSPKLFHAWQHWFALPLFMFYWLSTQLSPMWITGVHENAAWNVHAGKYFTAESHKWTTRVLKILHLASVLFPPVWHYGFGLHAAMCISVCVVSASIIWTCIFILSHNFEGSDRDPRRNHHLEKRRKVCWARMQVVTSASYGGKWTGWITGGVNFQIEHHLFPRICSAWYPYIQPVIREICKKHGVRYTYFPTMAQNAASTLAYLANVANPKTHRQ